MMTRFFTLIVAGILFIGVTSFLFFQTGVTIKMDMPDVIEAGTEVAVNVTINKGKLTGFAQFRQDLPYGFTAVAVNSANANFSFQDQQLRLTWLRVPEDDEINFTYKMVANERLTGKIDLNARFSYIDNNDRKWAEVQPMMLAIQPSPNVDPLMRVDVQDYAKIAGIEAVVARGGQTASLRQQPVWVEEEKVFLVTLLVNRDANQKYTKIEETVPPGYTAANIDSKGGIFTFKDQVAKFIWMDLPSDPYFTITYKLIPEGDTPSGADPPRLAGAFSYMLNDRTFSSVVTERKESLADLNRDQVYALLREVPTQATEQPVLIAGASTTAPATPATPTAPTSSRRAARNAGDMLAPESGVYYRVQIAAGHKPVNTQRYFRKHKLDYSVMRESHDGWWKYSVGSFDEYKAARDYRVHLSATTTLHDVFIAAYNNGNRITVQDALMASNQKWYK